VGPTLGVVVTTRALRGASVGPYASFNLATHVGDDPEAVGTNRRSLALLAALPGPVRYARQVHGTFVEDASEDTGEREADAIVVRSPGVPVGILTADCVPVVLAAADGSVACVAHAGWRGLAGGVIENAVHAMGCVPGAIRAWIGPAIGAECYEIGDEVRHAFVVRNAADAAAFAPTRRGHWRCDLMALTRSRLARVGVGVIDAAHICTACDARFYSYRREGRTGRFATVAWLRSTARQAQ
jgi:YfiH family protein